MSKRLDENLGTVDYDGLIVTNEPVADVFTVTIRKEASAEAMSAREIPAAIPAAAAAKAFITLCSPNVLNVTETTCP